MPLNYEISDAEMQIVVTLRFTLRSINEAINVTLVVNQYKYLEHMFVFNMGLTLIYNLLTDIVLVFGR